jgi:hypothetical protein
MNIRSRFPHLDASFILSLFLGFRLVYIPASILSHSGHGGVWTNTILALALTFGGEWLAGRTLKRLGNRRQPLIVVILSLLLLGLFPEEAPVGLILWAGTGLAWGEWKRGVASSPAWLAVIPGALLGATGLFGPGSWIMAILLLPRLRRGGGVISDQ